VGSWELAEQLAGLPAGWLARWVTICWPGEWPHRGLASPPAGRLHVWLAGRPEILLAKLDCKLGS
jgi:hypothetical protein